MQAVIGALRAVLGLDSLAFEKGVGSAQKSLTQLEKSFGQFGKSTASIARSLNGALGAIGVGLSLAGLVAFRKQLGESIAELKDNADRLGISTDQYQAYEAAALRAGVSTQQLAASLEVFNRKLGDAMAGKKEAIDFFEKTLGVKLLDAQKNLRPFPVLLQETAAAVGRLGTAQQQAAAQFEGFGKSGKSTVLMLGELSRGAQELVDQAAATGQIIRPDTIKRIDETNKAIKQLWSQYNVLIADIAGGIELSGLEALQRIIKSIVDDIDRGMKLSGGKAGGAVGAMIGAGTSEGFLTPDQDKKRLADEKEIKRLEEQVTKWRETADSLDNPALRVVALQRAEEVEKRIAAIRANMPEIGTGPREAPPGAPIPPSGRADDTHGPNAVFSRGVFNPTATGGGGQSPEQRARESMKAWREELQMYAETLRQLSADTAAPLDDFERRLESQRRITERLRTATKGISDPALLAEIKAQVTATEEARIGWEEYRKAAQDADAAERQFGDGSVALAAQMRDLNAALATGRLSQEAYAIASDEAALAAERQRLAMIGLADQGYGGFIAGIQMARMEWERANTTFAMGQQFFESTMRGMEDALTQFVQTADFSFKAVGQFFKNLAATIIAELIKIQIRAAAASLFGGAGGGGLFGNLFGSMFGGGGTATGSHEIFHGFASGGRPIPGMPSIVGERGPEIFVPDRAGRIIANDDLGGLGGVTVNQNISINGGDQAGVERALMKLRPVLRRDAVEAVQNARQRGGNFAAAFRA